MGDRASFWLRFGYIQGFAGAVIHAVDSPPTRGKTGKRRTVDAVCGKQRIGLLVCGVVDAEGNDKGSMTLAWPPYAADAKAEGRTRCPECMRLAPGKPSRMADDLTGYGERKAS